LVKKVFTTIILIIVALFFIAYVTPQIEAIPTANITNDFVVMMLGLAKWVVPVGAIAGVILGVFTMFHTNKVSD